MDQSFDRFPRGPLLAVSYYMLPDLLWQRYPGHVLEFGLELRFSDGLIAMTWDPRTGGLDMSSVGLADRLIEPHVMDATALDTWSRLVGRRVEATPLFQPSTLLPTREGQPCGTVLRFDDGTMIWIVAGNPLDEIEGMDEADRLVPFGDDIFVIEDPVVAERLGVTDWRSYPAP
jgi:hypothetical protein